MATLIKLKRSAVQNNIPAASQLEIGELALNTYDGKLYTKKSVNGTESVVELGGGSSGSAFNRYSFTATANQTAFNCVVPINAVYVYLNGLLLNPTVDYSFSGSVVTLVSGAQLNDELEVFTFGGVVLDDITTTYVKRNFTASANQTTITTNYNAGLIDVYLNGVKLVDGIDYTATNGTTIVFSPALSLNDIIETIAWNASSVQTSIDDTEVFALAAL